MILLDTHVLAWLALEPERLSRAARSAIRRAAHVGVVCISAISLWELAWLTAHGRVRYSGTVESFLTDSSSKVAIRPITVSIAVLATQLPADYPQDLCDRIIGATAVSEGMTLITKDSKIRECAQIATIW